MQDTSKEFETYLDNIVTAGMARTERFYAMWNESLRYFFSDQLHGKKKRKNWDWVVVNYIWPSAMQEIAKLSKNPPKIICQPWDDSDVESAEAWQSKLQWDWQQGINKKGMRLEQIKAILDGKLYGYRISKIYWEEKDQWDGKKWLGNVKHKLWHPALFWADGQEDIDEGNCGTDRYATLDWAIKRWPKHKKHLTDNALSYREVRSAVEKYNIVGQPSNTGTVGYGESEGGFEPAISSNILDIITGFDPMTQEPIESDIKLVKIEEIYLKDYAEEEIEIKQDVPADMMMQTGQIYQADGMFYNTQDDSPMEVTNWPQETVEKYKRPKYPNGRFILRIAKKVLEDKPYEYSRWPFVVTPHYLLPHMWQGVDSVQMYKDAQDMINTSVSHLFNNLKMFGDPKIAVETGAIATPPGRNSKHYKIGCGAGSIIRLVKGALSRGSFKILDPPQPSATALSLYQLFAQEYKNIQGLQSIARGEKTPGKMSATESVHLAMSSEDRIALQSVYEEVWVIECCKLIAEISQKNYDPGRWIRIVGEDQIAGVAEITQQMKDVRFDVSIIPGTTLPFDEEKRIEKYLKAYELTKDPMPSPMLPDMLRILDIHNWKKILEQHQAYQLYMQFVQLYEAVKAGEVTPEQATQMIITKAMELYGRSSNVQNGGRENNVQNRRENNVQGRENNVAAAKGTGAKQPANTQ